MSDVNTNPNDFTTRQSEIHQLNSKLMFDDTMAEMSEARKVKSSHDNAWETLRFALANDSQRIKHLAELNVVISAQTGDTANQQTTSPIRTGVADNLAAGSIPANRAIDASVADAALGNVTTQLSVLTDQVSTLAALLAQYVTNAGNAAAASAASGTGSSAPKA